MRRLLPVLVTTAVFVVGFMLCSLQFQNFASTRVVANLLTDNAFLGIVAVGMTFVIISGGIDLSVGSVIGFTTVFLAIAIERYGIPPFVAFAIVLVICLLFGAALSLAFRSDANWDIVAWGIPIVLGQLTTSVWVESQ